MAWKVVGRAFAYHCTNNQDFITIRHFVLARISVKKPIDGWWHQDRLKATANIQSSILIRQYVLELCNCFSKSSLVPSFSYSISLNQRNSTISSSVACKEVYKDTYSGLQT